MAQMLKPGPDHPITTSHPPARARALFHGHLLADSDHTLVLREAGHPARIYFPRGDVEMSVLTKNPNTTHCPYKGEASYFTLNRDKQVVEDVAWSYEHPYPAMEDIAGMISFDLGQVDIQTEVDVQASREAAAMADYIRHTDSGSGRSQEEHWPPNVGMPETGDEDEDGRTLS